MASNIIIEDALTIASDNYDLPWKAALTDGATKIETLPELGNDLFILEAKSTLYCNAACIAYLAPALHTG